MDYELEFKYNIDTCTTSNAPKINNTCCCQKCEITALGVEIMEINGRFCFIATNNINKFVTDYNSLFVDPIICVRRMYLYWKK